MSSNLWHFQRQSNELKALTFPLEHRPSLNMENFLLTVCASKLRPTSNTNSNSLADYFFRRLLRHTFHFSACANKPSTEQKKKNLSKKKRKKWYRLHSEMKRICRTKSRATTDDKHFRLYAHHIACATKIN